MAEKTVHPILYHITGPHKLGGTKRRHPHPSNIQQNTRDGYPVILPILHSLLLTLLLPEYSMGIKVTLDRPRYP